MAAPARARALIALAGVLACAVLGCSDAECGAVGRDRTDAASPADAGAFAMELGKGELAFAPLADGEALPYEHGPQGGQHVWVAFRMHDLEPARVLVQVTTAVDGHDELVLERRGRVDFERDEGSAAYVYAGWPAQILDAVKHEGERVRIEVVLEDRAARRARTSVTIAIAAAE